MLSRAFGARRRSDRAATTPTSLPCATWVGICHEGEPGGCLARISKEGTELSTVEFEPTAQEGRVLGGVTPIRPSVGDDQPDAHHRRVPAPLDRKSTRLNSSHANISYAVFCLKK